MPPLFVEIDINRDQPHINELLRRLLDSIPSTDPARMAPKLLQSPSLVFPKAEVAIGRPLEPLPSIKTVIKPNSAN